MTRPPSERRITARSGSFALPAYPNVDYSLLTAAGRIVEGALSVVSGEGVAIIVSAEQRAFGETLATVAQTISAKPQLLILEDHGARPHEGLAPTIAEALAQSQASVFCADSRPDEKPMRLALLSQTTKLGIRHAHLVGVTRRSLLAGFSAEPRRLAEAARVVRVRARPSSIIRVRSPAGTDLTVRCDPACRWSDHTSPIRAGRWENLPAGEVLTCPADVNGTYVATASMSSSFGIQREALRHCPIRLGFEHGVLKRMESPEEGLCPKLWQKIRATPNTERVGLLLIGTNVGVHEPTGDIITDKTLPGAHLWLGKTLADETGARWSSDAWVAFTAEGTDVDLDDVPLIRQGRYVVL